MISTDYRDLRKSAFQEYVVAPDYNVAKLPPTITPHAGAGLGVAFVAAAFSLGICMGLDFRDIAGGPDLLQFVRALNRDSLPIDVRDECFSGLDIAERASAGDWIAIWGGTLHHSPQPSVVCTNYQVQGHLRQQAWLASWLDLQECTCC